MPDFNSIISTIHSQLDASADRGSVATYIPELAGVDEKNFGIYLNCISGESHKIGAWNKPFSIQSISKVLSLAQAFSLVGDSIWKRVDVEPSGNPFNHLSLLELENGIPRNPLINAGALVIADILVSQLDNPKEDFLDYVRNLTNDFSIQFNTKVALSEKSTGFRNYAAANLLKSFGNLNNDVETVLDFYFHQCSLEMNCEQLSNAFYFLANRGKCMRDHAFLNESQVKRINALMLTCGFYDEAGEFAFEVGLPGKSGVGGGIIALLPNQFTIATWSPGLNEKGNSHLGMQALEKFTTATQLSIF
ncbi:glutaminase [Aureisphaera galaxeae]|uniref:glutaminase n=1 Tax=Aureisphaera galaxeae TaxID=1538023 RepID=UPI002350CC64|nr:glutaminase [Aureisphaera galaxeae]MDC8004122.1 glutaminase [Aureisphaera galaxeae]